MIPLSSLSELIKFFPKEAKSPTWLNIFIILASGKLLMSDWLSQSVVELVTLKVKL